MTNQRFGPLSRSEPGPPVDQLAIGASPFPVRQQDQRTGCANPMESRHEVLPLLNGYNPVWLFSTCIDSRYRPPDNSISTVDVFHGRHRPGRDQEDLFGISSSRRRSERGGESVAGESPRVSNQAGSSPRSRGGHGTRWEV